MEIPMSRVNISVILNIDESDVERLWMNDDLRRSIEGEGRSVNSRHQTGVLDVLEFLLSSDSLEVKLSREIAALWVTNLAEVLEFQRLKKASPPEIVQALYEMSLEDGLCQMSEDPQRVSSICVATFQEIYQKCSSAHNVVSGSVEEVATEFEEG